MRTRDLLVLGYLILLSTLAVKPAHSQTKLLRFPDVHGDKVVFTYGGDLWLASTSGGLATRLTSHPGLELFAKFSPDGNWIAFTGQYDGDEQVYVIPATGGVPRQLTFYPARGPLTPRWGYDNQVYGWTPDGKSVLFRSGREYFDLGDSRLYTVPVAGGMPEALPMPKSGAGDLSADASKVVYSPLFRDFRTWKRYEGGWAQQLYIFDVQSHSAEKITEGVRSHRDPMWVGSKIYYCSDADGTLNLYSYDPARKKTDQLTHSTKWDVRWPSTDHKNQIVYESDGELNILDLATGQSKHVTIQVPNDGVFTRPAQASAAGQIEDYGLSPKAERAVFVARGDVFTAPIEKGPTRNLTDSSNAHDKWARWSPDGAKIAFISDLDGEDEVYLVNQDGSAKPEQLTRGLQAMLYAPEWAPDGRRLAFSDKDGKLFVLTLDDKKFVQISRSPDGRLRDYVWSHDGGHLAFTMSNPNGFSSLYVWSTSDSQVHRVTSDLFNSGNPAWDPDGNYLYYLADHDFQPAVSQVEFDFATDRSGGVFALALRKDVKNPFPPESDEVTIAKDGDKSDKAKPDDKDKDKEGDKSKKEKSDKKEEKKREYIRIDFDGLADRVTRVPLEGDNFDGLAVTKDFLVYGKAGTPFYGRDSYPLDSLVLYSLKDRKEATLAENIRGFSVSDDGKKILVRSERDFKLYDAKPEGKSNPKTVSTGNLTVDRVPQQEWKEIFNEVWRRYRDFFFARNMNGYDWDALRQQYSALVPFVAHRSDLNYVLGEMVSELNASHSYIEGGDYDVPKRPQAALMGARLELDHAAGRYRIAKIYHGQNEEELYRSPLTEVGVDARDGDYILAIDGEDLTASKNPFQLLLNKANRPVQLTLNSKPSTEGARQITYKPITTERNLIYLDWVARNRDAVSKATHGRVGYIHIPDMGAAGIREFIKFYYPQIRKEALIVDVRGNGGGNISQMLIQRLLRPLLGTGFDRVSDYTNTYPNETFYGPKVCLINETSASDGDIFPHMFRQAGLGPLIGKRTWGGVVGISGRGPLLDGGNVFVPEFATASAEGKYVIEGHGVDPDIVVENEPAEVIAGGDPQLERGIAEVMKALEASPKKLPARPPDPVKTPKR
ncbi:MAG TPA: S41 family peptidase [Candidatus Eisenbacteria bacterium]|nr:S41 family peptidase [Candidatus Eisenbacteria bacterium]